MTVTCFKDGFLLDDDDSASDGDDEDGDAVVDREVVCGTEGEGALASCNDDGKDDDDDDDNDDKEGGKEDDSVVVAVDLGVCVVGVG